MATRLYLENTVADVDPATERGAWNDTASYSAIRLSRVRAGAITTKAVAETSATGDFDVLLLKIVSEPIPAQSITGTLDWSIGALESDTLMNAHWHLHVFVTQGDTDSLRGTLLTDYTEAAGTNEFPTTAQGWAADSAQTLTSVTALDNDRIVIEIGYVARNVDVTSFTGTLWYGGTNGEELPRGSGDETALTGWVAFSQDLFPTRPRRKQSHRSPAPHGEALTFLVEDTV